MHCSCYQSTEIFSQEVWRSKNNTDFFCHYLTSDFFSGQVTNSFQHHSFSYLTWKTYYYLILSICWENSEHLSILLRWRINLMANNLVMCLPNFPSIQSTKGTLRHIIKTTIMFWWFYGFNFHLFLILKGATLEMHWQDTVRALIYMLN